MNKYYIPVGGVLSHFLPFAQHLSPGEKFLSIFKKIILLDLIFKKIFATRVDTLVALGLVCVHERFLFFLGVDWKFFFGNDDHKKYTFFHTNPNKSDEKMKWMRVENLWNECGKVFNFGGKLFSDLQKGVWCVWKVFVVVVENC